MERAWRAALLSRLLVAAELRVGDAQGSTASVTRQRRSLSVPARSLEGVTGQDWERRLPDGVQVKGRDSDGFRIGVSVPAGEDGLWPMRCPQQPRDHVFKVQVSQEQELASAVYCPYCGYREDLWEFAPEQRVVAEAAAMAVAEQQVAAKFDDMLREAFGGPARPTKSHSGFGIDISYRPGPPLPRRTLPDIRGRGNPPNDECERCQEHFAVYGLSINCLRTAA